MLKNPILLTDSYKTSHWLMYPPKMSNMYSYFESRGGEFEKVVFYGLNYYLREYLSIPITKTHIQKAKRIIDRHIGPNIFNEEGWNYIVENHGGHLPIIIKSVDEGSLVQTKNVLITVENTDPNVAWLTNYVETILCQVWYPCTVATQSYYMKQTILEYLKYNGTPEDIDFKLHDFGFRGVTCPEQAAIGGSAHLLNFKGTDTLAAIELLEEYYNANEMPGFSIPASEHSTITVWGKENEKEAIQNILEKFPSGLVACVSDSYNIYECCEKIYGETLHDKIIYRNGVLVIRPDSGDPTSVLPNICHTIGEKFGYTTNSKGYKVLNEKVRLIQGDGVDRLSLNGMLYALKTFGWSSDNLGFGSGGGLLQKVNRDTCKFAFKCSSAVVNEEERDVFKDPITDPGKTSKRGRLGLTTDFKTVKESEVDFDSNALITRFKNGVLCNAPSFDEVRKKLNG